MVCTPLADRIRGIVQCAALSGVFYLLGLCFVVLASTLPLLTREPLGSHAFNSRTVKFSQLAIFRF